MTKMIDSTVTVQNQLKNDLSQLRTFRAVADKYRINVRYVWDLVHLGKEPHNLKARLALGLPPLTNVMILVVSGNIPDNCQVLGRYRVCQCGQRFVPNCAPRKRCYTCSPYNPHKESK